LRTDHVKGKSKIDTSLYVLWDKLLYCSDCQSYYICARTILITVLYLVFHFLPSPLAIFVFGLLGLFPACCYRPICTPCFDLYAAGTPKSRCFIWYYILSAVRVLFCSLWSSVDVGFLTSLAVWCYKFGYLLV